MSPNMAGKLGDLSLYKKPVSVWDLRIWQIKSGTHGATEEIEYFTIFHII